MIMVPALLFIALLAYGLLKASPSAFKAGDRAPAFQLPIFAGGAALPASTSRDGRLTSAELRGRPVLLNFWASWCVPCRREAPLLERTWRAYRNKGIVFVGVNIKDSPGDARRFLREFHITYPQARGEQSPSAVDDYGVTGVPETFFLDQRWFFIDTVTGVQTGQQNGLRVLGAIEPDVLQVNLDALVREAHAPGGRAG